VEAALTRFRKAKQHRLIWQSIGYCLICAGIGVMGFGGFAMMTLRSV